MKKYLFCFVAFAFSCTAHLVSAQSQAKNVVVVNGGVYEFSAPFADYVTVGVLNTATSVYQVIDTIKPDQSAQDVVIVGDFAYVAAEKTIVKYNLNTKQRVATSATLFGIRKIKLVNDKLIVTLGYGSIAGSSTIKILNASTLSIVSDISGVTKFTEGIALVADSAYVTSPGSFTDTTGSIIVVNINNNQLVRSIQLGSKGGAIGKIYTQGVNIYSLSTVGYNSPFGYVNKVNTQTGIIENTKVNGTVAEGAGIYNGLILARFTSTGGIGSFSLANNMVVTPKIIPFAVAGSVVDTTNGNIWASSADYNTNGKLFRYNIGGSKLDSFNIGISAEAMAIQYGNVTGITFEENHVVSKPYLYPNPAKDLVYVGGTAMFGYTNICVYSATGTVIWQQDFNLNGSPFLVPTHNLVTGLYYVKVMGNNGLAHTLKLVIE